MSLPYSLDAALAAAAEKIVLAQAEKLARPSHIHQRSVEQVIGLPSTDFLEFARVGAFQTYKVRRLVFAQTAAVVDFIERHAVTPAAAGADDAEAVALARVGARRVSE